LHCYRLEENGANDESDVNWKEFADNWPRSDGLTAHSFLYYHSVTTPSPCPSLLPQKSQALQSEHINKQNRRKDCFWLMYYGDRYLNNLITFCELPTNASANDKTHIYIGLPVKLLFHVS